MAIKNLVIVESPTKAKTISKFLGSDYKIESSFGHIRDLPKSKLGVDIENNFDPQYVIPVKSKKRATELKKLADKAQNIYFATDEDREGEAISWHLVNIFKTPKNKIKRIVFHEITEDAIKEALKNPRELDLHLVDAQQARRVLDRLVGYQLSPFLWKKVARGLSAGRVQSVAVRLIVEREREIQAFNAQEYWSIESIFNANNQNFESKLNKIDDKVIDKLEISNEEQANKILKDLEQATYVIEKVEKKQTKKKALPPFTTSTLQQAANSRLGFSAKQTMMLAQQLYEGIELGSEGSVGLITYMRTDSLNLATKFLDEAAEYITTQLGKQYHAGIKKYSAKSKLAQEAHEAIRPTLAKNDPASVRPYLNDRQFKLYQLIWQRAISSQMAEAVMDNTTVDIKAQKTPYTFRSTGSIIKFDGFLKIYPTSTKENILPDISENQTVNLVELKPLQHFTQPPARYTEAALVKALEEYGIGRPSTYAPTISTVQERGYVEKEEKKLKPTEMAFLVNDLLVEHFPKIVDYQFTAHMEDDLDEVAEGKKEWQPVIKNFWEPFKENLDKKDSELTKKELTEQASDEVCDKCGKPMVIKVGRYGKFLACTGYPECKNTKPLDGETGEPQGPVETGEKCPECEHPLVKRKGRYGEFVGCSNYPKCKYIKKEAAQTFGTCPACGKGKIVGKRSRRGFFYACDQYPDCKNALWGKPYIEEGQSEPEKCPDCGSILVHGPKDSIKCSSRECKYKR
ncbi:MAG: type I DNA topoisomerase [Candidatus Buchananbacteria bacterium]|nr:type I DNA topoisomerase [Candidatus Buchananbacteria bacterium]